MSELVDPPALESRRARHAGRRVVMVASAGMELGLSDVATNLATVCAEVGQRVALISTAGLASPDLNDAPPQPVPLLWKHWPPPANGAALPAEDDRARLQSGPVSPTDVEDLLGETGVPGVSRLDLRHFVGHPAQVVIRVPEVLSALEKIVDVVILEVPSYLSVHHGEALTPLADVVLIVGEYDTTTMGEMRRTSATLRHLDAPVVGMALTHGPIESYDWGVTDPGLEPPDWAHDHRDPTEQIPIAESAGVAPAPPVGEPLDELSLGERSAREA